VSCWQTTSVPVKPLSVAFAKPKRAEAKAKSDQQKANRPPNSQNLIKQNTNSKLLSKFKHNFQLEQKVQSANNSIPNSYTKKPSDKRTLSPSVIRYQFELNNKNIQQ